MDSLSVIIPALNEEAFLGGTLRNLADAIQRLRDSQDCLVQIIVVDNDSQDRTAEVARHGGATVVQEPVRNIARARNTGARAADGAVLFFLDADTLIPPCLLEKIHQVMADRSCDGGAVAVDHRPSRKIVRLYLRAWGLFGRLTRMAQGAAQFCRRDAFLKLDGYNESLSMGEDVDFYWRLPSELPVEGASAEEYVDSTGDEALRVSVLLREDFDEDKISGEAVNRLKLSIHDSLIAHGIHLYPYVWLMKPSDLLPEPAPRKRHARRSA